MGGSLGGVAIVASSCSVDTPGRRPAVNAFLIDPYGVLELYLKTRNQLLVFMTLPTSGGQVQRVNVRPLVTDRENPVEVVAISTGWDID
jgi:hypothetical protein